MIHYIQYMRIIDSENIVGNMTLTIELVNNDIKLFMVKLKQ